MTQQSKVWGILGAIAILIAIFMFLLDIGNTKERFWQIVKSKELSILRTENKNLKSEIKTQKKLNMSLKKYSDAYKINFLELKDASKDCYQKGDYTTTIRICSFLLEPDELNKAEQVQLLKIRGIAYKWKKYFKEHISDYTKVIEAEKDLKMKYEFIFSVTESYILDNKVLDAEEFLKKHEAKVIFEDEKTMVYFFQIVIAVISGSATDQEIKNFKRRADVYQITDYYKTEWKWDFFLDVIATKSYQKDKKDKRNC